MTGFVNQKLSTALHGGLCQVHVISARWEVEEGGTGSKANPMQKYKILSEKQPRAKRAGGMAQMVEHLHSKCKAMSSNPSTALPPKITTISM
jgi:hypothetical protein